MLTKQVWHFFIGHAPEAGSPLLRGALESGDTMPMGTWHELHVGRSWQNSFAVDLIWRDPDGFPGMPQILIVERTVTHEP